MSLLDDVAKRDGWRCWVCDEPVDAGAGQFLVALTAGRR